MWVTRVRNFLVAGDCVRAIPHIKHNSHSKQQQFPYWFKYRESAARNFNHSFAQLKSISPPSTSFHYVTRVNIMIFRNSHCTENYCSNSHHFALYFSHLSGVKAFLTVILPRLTTVKIINHSSYLDFSSQKNWMPKSFIGSFLKSMGHLISMKIWVLI